MPASASSAVLADYDLLESTLYRIPDGRFMCPGFVDTHCHAPQYSFSGTATDKPLMSWLDEYTFPRESRHQDLTLARTEYIKLVQRLLSNGTTTALYFASLHLEPTQLLAQLLHQMGQRAYVGLVCMDRNSKDFYVKSLDQNATDTETFIATTRALGSSLVHPVVTPRFVPTCSPQLLARLGALAQRHGCHVQSHISESLDNDAFVAHLHPEVSGRDAALYDRAGLLTNRAVMAHGVMLTSAELALLAARGTAIAHCPLSNFFFADIPLDVLRCRELGVKVGLGTDVAGGYSPSMLNAMRSAVLAAKAVQMLRTDRARLAKRDRAPDGIMHEDAEQTRSRQGPSCNADAGNTGRAASGGERGFTGNAQHMREDPEARPEIGSAQRDDSRAAHNAATLPYSASTAFPDCEASGAGLRDAETAGVDTSCATECSNSGGATDCRRPELEGGISVDGLGTRGELDYRDAFWLATMGGAQALGLEAKIGSFEVGKEFDALMIDAMGVSTFDTFTGDKPLDVFQKFINLGDDRNIRAVWVQGGLVLWK
ncbi:hypothetical protein WJX75_002216 [Coccomyxa subellipsoidea]|uniref:Amidohydrolase-related domain-containing protein n=1 Tax=Coccomyxa subellipsoidea TaxID=248742 RepID=A0ABR2YB76_9CHLO